MDTPFKAYRGNEKYIFISYAHKDTANVFPAIKALNSKGYRIWYDEGIEAGEDWSAKIAENLNDATVVLSFLTRNSAASENVRRELAFAAEKQIPVLTVMIGKFKLTAEQEKQVTVNQYLKLDSYQTYGEFADACGPALDRYGVCGHRTESETDPQPDQKSDQQPDQKPNPQPDEKPDQQPDQKPNPQPNPQPDEKPDQRSDQKPDIDKDIDKDKDKESSYSERILLHEEKRKAVIKGIGITAAILLAGLLVFFLLFRKVPSVVGMDSKDAEISVKDSGFRPMISLNYSDEYEYGKIMEQSAEGTMLKLIPVVITQSLGPEENLTDVPDVTNREISDGAKLLIDAGLKKFTVIPETESAVSIGYISAQSIPAGLRVSRSNTISLDVRTDGGTYTFTIEGREYRLSGTEAVFIDIDADRAAGESAERTATEPEEKETQEGVKAQEAKTGPLDLKDRDRFKMTEEEWALFYANSSHSIWAPKNYTNVWLPAAVIDTVREHPEECYGWVIVRDMTMNADDLFQGYSELYVCPGITVTVRGNVKDTDSFNDFYVAPGGTLIFTDEVSGGVYLVNDGITQFRKNLNGGRDGVLIANRGAVEVSGSIGSGVQLWSFYASSVTGTDNTGGTLHDYSPYRQVTATNWYEGCSGPDGIAMILDKLETFATYFTKEAYEADDDANMITPVINPEDYEKTYTEEFYTAIYLFLSDYTVKVNRTGRGVYWGFIAAPGVQLTIDLDKMHAGIFAEEGSTVTINTDADGVWPYSPYFINDGTMIINGNIVINEGVDGTMLMNRGNLIVNGTFGGPQMSLYNFAGSSATGNILESTYRVDLDFRPEYVTYENGPGGALRYQEEYLTKVLGYKYWLD